MNNIKFASEKEIMSVHTELNDYTDEETQSGIVLGENIFTNKALLHDGPSNIFVMTPPTTINAVFPSMFTWKESLFCLDKNTDLWRVTAGYRKKKLGQKVFKFAPLCADFGSAHWNPLAEIRFRTPLEFQDVSMLSEFMMSSNVSQSEHSSHDTFWDRAASIFFKGVVLHLLYAHQTEGKRVPSMGDVVGFLMNPVLSIDNLCDIMLSYPHISPEESGLPSSTKINSRFS